MESRGGRGRRAPVGEKRGTAATFPLPSSAESGAVFRAQAGGVIPARPHGMGRLRSSAAQPARAAAWPTRAEPGYAYGSARPNGRFERPRADHRGRDPVGAPQRRRSSSRSCRHQTRAPSAIEGHGPNGRNRASAWATRAPVFIPRRFSFGPARARRTARVSGADLPVSSAPPGAQPKTLRDKRLRINR